MRGVSKLLKHGGSGTVSLIDPGGAALDRQILRPFRAKERREENRSDLFRTVLGIEMSQGGEANAPWEFSDVRHEIHVAANTVSSPTMKSAAYQGAP